jgi:hypothetical protein
MTDAIERRLDTSPDREEVTVRIVLATIIKPTGGLSVCTGTVMAQPSRKLMTDANAAIGGAVIATVGISKASKPLVRVATRVIKSARAARSWMYSTAVIPLARSMRVRTRGSLECGPSRRYRFRSRQQHRHR